MAGQEIKQEDWIKVTDKKPMLARYYGKVGKVVSLHPRSNMPIQVTFTGCGLPNMGFKESEVEVLAYKKQAERKPK